MTDSDEILILQPDETDPDSDYSDMYEQPQRRWLAPLLTLLGALLGFAAAFAASWYTRPALFDPAPLEAEIERLSVELAELRDRPVPVAPRVNLGPINRRLDALEARPSAEPVDEGLIARMEALQANGFEIPELPDVDALEARMAELETQLAMQSAQLETLEARPVSVPVSDVGSQSDIYVDPASLPRFPRQVLRDGAAELAGSGLLRRTFARHVQVRGEDNPDRLIDGIVKDLRDGNPRAALDKFDRLPPELQSLARGWRADMEDAIP